MYVYNHVPLQTFSRRPDVRHQVHVENAVLNVYNNMCVYIYIYIYICRERDVYLQLASRLSVTRSCACARFQVARASFSARAAPTCAEVVRG